MSSHEKTSDCSCKGPKTDKCECDEKKDVISKSIGDFGRWQLQLTFLLSLFNLPCTWHIYAMTFQAPEVEFWCAPPEGLESLDPDLWRNISHTPPVSHVSKNRLFRYFFKKGIFKMFKP